MAGWLAMRLTVSTEHDAVSRIAWYSKKSGVRTMTDPGKKERAWGR